uniref:Uncharacterized protein n=1 Tax=Cucumis melo TaxID=3656 RepID=A0A9I9E8Q4_CUCME
MEMMLEDLSHYRRQPWHRSFLGFSSSESPDSIKSPPRGGGSGFSSVVESCGIAFGDGVAGSERIPSVVWSPMDAVDSIGCCEVDGALVLNLDAFYWMLEMMKTTPLKQSEEL